MRAVIQRVTSASVAVGSERVAAISRGLLALVGFQRGDTHDDLLYIAHKVPQLRIFPDEAGKFSLSLLHLGLSVLVVSQFTLFADTRKGLRPSFTDAEEPERSRELFDRFILLLKSEVGEDKVQYSPFGAMMKVSLVNDGPVTIWMDSREKTRR